MVGLPYIPSLCVSREYPVTGIVRWHCLPCRDRICRDCVGHAIVDSVPCAPACNAGAQVWFNPHPHDRDARVRVRHGCTRPAGDCPGHGPLASKRGPCPCCQHPRVRASTKARCACAHAPPRRSSRRLPARIKAPSLAARAACDAPAARRRRCAQSRGRSRRMSHPRCMHKRAPSPM